MQPRLAFVTLLAIGPLGLAACGSSASSGSPGSDAAAVNSPSSAAPTVAPTSSAAAPSSAATSSSESSAPIALTGAINDAVYGNAIKVLSLVRNFPIPARYPAIKGQREIVLVKMSFAAGSKYTGGIEASAFSIINAEGSDLNSQTTIVDDEMKAAGYAPFSNGGTVSSGSSATGWVAFTVDPPNSSKLTLEYKRLAASVIGGGGSIPAKTFTVALAT